MLLPHKSNIFAIEPTSYPMKSIASLLAASTSNDASKTTIPAPDQWMSLIVLLYTGGFSTDSIIENQKMRHEEYTH